jgi:phasin family protein
VIKTPQDFQTEALKAGTAALEEAFKGAQKLADLNLSNTRAALDTATAHIKAILSAKDPQALTSLITEAATPSAEPLAAYAKDVYAIASETFAALRGVTEQRLADAQKTFAASLEAALANAPAGSEAAVSFIRSAIDTANRAYSQAVESNKTLFDIAEANLTGATKAAAATSAKKKA